MPDITPGEQDDQTLSPSATDATSGTDQTTPDANAQSSSAEADASQGSAKEPETMAEAIAQALNAEGNPAEQPAPADAADADAEAGSAAKTDPNANPQNPDPKTNAAPDGELPDDPTEDELKAYKPNVRKRIDKLLEQRAIARAEAEQAAPDAQNWRSIRKFMQDQNLSDADAADLFRAGAELKSGTEAGFRSFLARVVPLVRMAQEALGEVVPEDLQPQVDAGEMTDEAARAFARQRQAAQLAQARAEQLQATTQQQQTQAAQQAMAQSIATWTQQKQATDPDFAAKQDVMRRVAQGLVAERGYPKTPQEAVKYSEDAYAEATRLLMAARPAKAPTRPTPTTAASPNASGVAPTPTSLHDIVAAGLAMKV
jgi:hypothetical protein